MGGCHSQEKQAKTNKDASGGADRKLNILLIGNANVGKSSITHRLHTGEFPTEAQLTTVEELVEKSYEFPDGTKELVRLIDTGGQEKFRTLTSSYYRGANGVIVVFDLNDLSSFQALENWFNEVDRYSESPLILVGNKKDLPESERVVKPEDISRYGHPYVECSALTGEGVQDVLLKMVEEIRSSKIQQ